MRKNVSMKNNHNKKIQYNEFTKTIKDIQKMSKTNNPRLKQLQNSVVTITKITR